MPLRMLAATARIHSGKGKDAVGSGVVIFSSRMTIRTARKRAGKKHTIKTRKIVHTYILTNWHVVDENISFTYARRRRMHDGCLSAAREKWEARRKPLEVQLFVFSNTNGRLRKRTYVADIVACSKELDLALLRLRSRTIIPAVAPLASRNAPLDRFEDVWAVGCTSTHTPIATKGNPVAVWKNVDQRARVITTTPISDCNSGGGLFRYVQRSDCYELIGITTETESKDIAHLAHSVPIRTIHEFLEDNSLEFILKHR